MLFATSCQNDLDMPQGAGETATVAFNISTPEIATRAYSDGTTAKDLQYAVYAVNPDKTLRHLEELNGQKEINLTTTVDLKLTTGNKYAVIFWADNVNAPYTFTPATQTLSVDYDAAQIISNNENLDAFYAYQEFTVSGAMSVDVDLYRPFAQINIGTADYEDSRKAGYVPTQSKVKVSNAYSTLNLATGEVSNGREVTFATADIKKNETFPVAGYEYLAMNYVLVDDVKSLVDVEFTYTDTKDAKTRTVGSVPVQRNYRTNIYGQLLTSDVDINVTINPIYNEPDYTVFEAFANGGTVTLTEDVVIDRPLVVKAGVSAVLNLNGHNIVNTTKSDVYGEGEGIIVYGDLTINGEGTVEGSTMAVWARGNDNAVVNIYGGTYKGCAEGFAKGGCSVVYASSGNIINFYGGKVEALVADKTSYADKTNGVYAALNVADNNGMINVYGGRFYKQNPAAPGTEPSAWNAAHPNGFVADGYSAVLADDWYVVGKTASNVAELKDALSNAPVVNVEQAIDNGSNALTINGNNLELNMEGNKITAGGQSTNNYAFNVYGSNVTVNNANVDGAGFAVMQESNLTINDGAINAKPGKSGRNMFYVTGNSTVTVKEGDYKFDRTSCYFVYVEAGCTCVIEGGNFYKPLANNASKDSFVNNGSAGTVIITGGTFNVDPSTWVATGYKAVKNGSIWTVVAE